MKKNICPVCQKTIRQLKHSKLCECGPKILFINNRKNEGLKVASK